MSDPEVFPEAIFGGRFRRKGPREQRLLSSIFPLERADELHPGRDYTALRIELPERCTESQRRRLMTLLTRNYTPLAGRVTVPVEVATDEQNNPWVVFETPWGEPLGDLLARGPLSVDDAGRVLLALAAGLADVHRANLFNGGLNPGDLWVSLRAGQPAVVTQLIPGLTALLHEIHWSEPQTVAALPVEEVALLAPEILRGEAPGHEVDVWSLALLAFELHTGASYWLTLRQPGTSLIELCKEILGHPYPPAAERALGAPRPDGMDAQLQDWFDRCIRFFPGERLPLLQAVSLLQDPRSRQVALFTPDEPEMVFANPKGSFYDDGLNDEPDGAGGEESRSEPGKHPYRVVSTPPREDLLIRGNPKGSFYDGGLLREGAPGGPRKKLVAALLVLVAAVAAYLVLRR